MKLLFDLVTIQPAWDAKYHGGGVYGENVFFSLIKRLSEFEMVCIYDSKKYIRNDIILKCGELNIKLYDVNINKPKEVINIENIDVFYTPRQQWEDDWILDVKRCVTTWHDFFSLELIYDSVIWSYAKSPKEIIKAFVRFAYPKYFFNRNYKRYEIMLKRGVDFVTVSNHSKASFLSFFPELKDKYIPVLYSPMFPKNIIEYNSALPCEVQEKKYFLLNSGSRWYKNNLRAILAFDTLFSDMKNLDFKVVLTGVTNKSIYDKISNKKHFIFLNFVESSMLELLYSKAYAFIYPSLNEGFGYPPIEAMYYGVPVAASGSTSIPEICGDAALYFDAHSIFEIKNRIIQLLDKNIYDYYANKSVERYNVISARQGNDLEELVNFILTGT